MGKTTSIAWTDSTLNLAWGCAMVSAGCENCYMFRNSPMARKDPEKITYFSIENARKKLPTFGKKVFVNDNTDTFGEFHADAIVDLWMQVFRDFPTHEYQLLTKRAGRMYNYFKTRQVPDNVWLGVSVENQGHLFRIETLRRIKTKIRFISFEPLLSAIKEPDLSGIHWIIIGGESGSNARLMKPEWAQDLIDYTRANYPETAIFFKQMGARENRDGAGGNLINGKKIQEFPKY